MATITVANEAALNNAIATVDAATMGAYTIQFTATVTEGTDGGGSLPLDLYAINLNPNVTLTIDGQGNALNGAGAYRGLFVYAGNVTVRDLTIENAHAVGGAGGTGGGGGGAGLGGGLFVAGINTGLASGGTVTLNGVTFLNNAAIGGAGGAGLGAQYDGGGGGGLGGAGGTNPSSSWGGGGGGIGAGAQGGGLGQNGAGGIVAGAGGGGYGMTSGSVVGGNGGQSGGGGGGGITNGFGGGGGIGGQNATNRVGGSGGFGGGGGGSYSNGGGGGFGGGGGGGWTTAGGGGFGGGGGGGGSASGVGGFGAGGGSNSGGGGGGGLGAGGDIFVQQGGVLTIDGGSLSGGSVTAGPGGGGTGDSGQSGQAFGAGIFIQGVQVVTFSPAAGRTLSISDVIADQAGTGGSGAGSVSVLGGGTVILDATNTYTGGTTIDAGSTLDLAANGAASSGAITFAAASADTLRLEAASLPGNAFGDTIFGFGPTDTIDLTGLTYLSGDTTASIFNGNLTVTNGTASDTLEFNGIANGSIFYTNEDAGSGTSVTIACFASGTLIVTSAGDVPVERLTVGDHMATVSGRMVPMKWLGHRHVNCSRHPEPRDVWPVRIRAGAFGDDLPRRDLWLSPDHAVFVNDVLIPIKYLINGRSIAQVPRAAITYYHIELDQHDVLFAEGLPAESYLDTGDRLKFSNAGRHITRPGDFSAREWEASACARLVLTGPILEAARRRISGRAGPDMSPEVLREMACRDGIAPALARSFSDTV